MNIISLLPLRGVFDFFYKKKLSPATVYPKILQLDPEYFILSTGITLLKQNKY